MKKARYILAMVLAVAMILTTVMPTAWASKNVTDASKGTEVTFDKGTTATADSGDRSMLKTKLEELSPKGAISKFELYQVDADEQVRIIVVFEGDALIDNYEVEEANSESAKAESARLTSAHNTFLRKLGNPHSRANDHAASQHDYQAAARMLGQYPTDCRRPAPLERKTNAKPDFGLRFIRPSIEYCGRRASPAPPRLSCGRQ